jgi:3-oxoadipate enol-lactonase
MKLHIKDGQELYYEVLGNAQSEKTLFFLNGLSQTTTSWGFVSPNFILDYKIVLVDFVFQGNSSKEGDWRTFDHHAQDLIDLADQLKLEHFIPIGLSYGSIVAQHLAVNYPSRIEKMVLLSTFAHKTPYYEAIELSWKRSLEMGGYGLMLDVMLPFVLSDNYFANPIIPIEMLKSVRKDMVEAKSLQKLMEATMALKDYRPQLKKVICPTLIIHGGRDTLFPIDFGKSVADHISNSLFVVIDEAGHTLNLESVTTVVTYIKDFI